MGVIECELLSRPLTEDLPCGEDLEYDPRFGELERAAQGKPEQQFGQTLVEAEPPDWAAVKRQALELLSVTRDLRVAALLAQALLHTDGLAGLSDGIRLTRRLLEEFWDSVHPRLDPDDDLDPTLRVNTLVLLCDPDRTLWPLRHAPLVSSRTVGRFSLRDVLVARGEMPPADGQSAPEPGVIEAAFLDADPDELRQTADALARAAGDVDAIESVLMERVGAAQTADLSALTHELKRAHALLGEQLTRRGSGETGATAVAKSEPVETEPAAAGNGAAGRSLGVDDLEIHTRADVVRALEKICEFYRQHEPSSPLPLLLGRAKRLVPMSFMELLRDMAPDGLPQVQALSGVSAEDGAHAA
jgi:type VI secretion system protein ImpA